MKNRNLLCRYIFLKIHPPLPSLRFDDISSSFSFSRAKKTQEQISSLFILKYLSKQLFLNFAFLDDEEFDTAFATLISANAYFNIGKN